MPLTGLRWRLGGAPVTEPLGSMAPGLRAPATGDPRETSQAAASPKLLTSTAHLMLMEQGRVAPPEAQRGRVAPIGRSPARPPRGRDAYGGPSLGLSAWRY